MRWGKCGRSWGRRNCDQNNVWKTLNDFINWKEKIPSNILSLISSGSFALLIDWFSLLHLHWSYYFSDQQKQKTKLCALVPSSSHHICLSDCTMIMNLIGAPSIIRQHFKKSIWSRYENHSELRFRIQHLWRHSTWDTLLSSFLSSHQELLPCTILNLSPFSKKDFKPVLN